MIAIPGARRVLAMLLICLQLVACASQREPASSPSRVSEAQRKQLGSIAVVQIVRPPKSTVDVGARGAAAGGMQGAAQGGVTGGSMALQLGGSCSDPMCGLVVIVLLPVFVVSGLVIGGVSGAVTATPKDQAIAIEAALAAGLQATGGADAFRTEVVNVAKQSGVVGIRETSLAPQVVTDEHPDYHALAAEGIDTVLEVGLVGVAFGGDSGSNPELKLGVQAAVRLVDARSNAELYHNFKLKEISPARRFDAWNRNDRLALKQEFERSYHRLAVTIIDEVFLVVRTN